MTLAGTAEIAVAGAGVRLRVAAAAETGRSCALFDAPAAFGPSCLAVERAEEACGAEESDEGLSAHATADPLNAAAPIPRATARPPTRPMKLAALTDTPFYDADNSCEEYPA